MQDRIPNVLEVLQKARATELSNSRVKSLIATLNTVIEGLIAFDAGCGAAETLRKLTGKQIWAGFAGMQLTDEVHYRLVYERDGTLRSTALGAKRCGKWSIEQDQLWSQTTVAMKSRVPATLSR